MKRQFKDNLKHYRILRGLSALELAERINCDVSEIVLMEAGQKRIKDAKKLQSIATALEVTPYSLIMGE